MMALNHKKMMMMALGLLVFWQGLAIAGPSGPGGQMAEQRRILDYLTAEVPEISEMVRQNREAKPVMQIDSAPDPAATNRFDRDFFHVYVGFNIQYKKGDSADLTGHRSRWATFLVHRNLEEILWVNNARGNTYVPLADWRKYVHGVDAEKTSDFICIPYMRAGRIGPFSSLEDIIRLYGADQVEKRTVYGPEGVGRFDVSVIYPNTANELLVYWDQNNYGTRPLTVSIRQPGSDWRTLYGIRVGTSLAELNQLNGCVFKFLGFNWDYGGAIRSSWDEGRLQILRPASLTLRSAPDLPRQYQGDRLLSSDMEELLRSGMVWVGRIDIPLK